jgi:cytochrome c peroxidase
VLPSEDQARGACLFQNARVFGQDPQGPFATCATCHYGSERTDRGVHLVQIMSGGVEQAQVLRKTPSLLKARVNFPYGWDGRFGTVQEAARAAILSPLEIGGTTVTDDQLDALAAFVLALGEPDESAPPAAEPSPGTLQRIAVGKEVFFGKGQCASCHPAPEFTTHAITTNQIHRSFTGPTDLGAAVVGTGGPSEFKVPSLLFFGAGQPFMHNGSLPKVDQLVRFYNDSLALNLTGAELTGLQYWLKNCLNPRRSPQPNTC